MIKKLLLTTALLASIGCSRPSVIPDLTPQKFFTARHEHNQGDIKYKETSYTLALEHYNEAIKAYPNYLEALGSKADTLKKLGRIDEYKQTLEYMLTIKPLNKTGAFWHGYSYLMREDINTAVHLIASSHSLLQGKVFAKAGQSYADDGNDINALFCFNMSDVHGGFFKYSLNLFNEQAQMYKHYAHLALIKEGYSYAAGVCRRARKLSPEISASIAGYIANEAIRKNEVKKSFDSVSELLYDELKAGTYEYNLYYLYGVYMFGAGKFEEAQKYLGHEDYTSFPNRDYYLGVCQYVKGLDQKDLTLRDGKNSIPFEIRTNSMKSAITTLKKHLKIHPKDANTHFFIGKCYYSMKQFSTANLQFKRAIEHNPTNAAYHLEYAKSLLKLGDTDLAKIELKKVKAIDEDYKISKDDYTVLSSRLVDNDLIRKYRPQNSSYERVNIRDNSHKPVNTDSLRVRIK